MKWLIFIAVVVALCYTFFPTLPFPKGAKVASLLLEKGQRRLTLLDENGRKIRSYHVSLGANPRGHKQKMGDERTPEGKYMIDFGNSQSRFYRSLHISYPNKADVNKARQQGFSPGGDIMIHGLPKSMAWIGRWHRWWDWTDGCVGLTNEEMKQIWEAVGNRRIPIEVKP